MKEGLNMTTIQKTSEELKREIEALESQTKTLKEEYSQVIEKELLKSERAGSLFDEERVDELTQQLRAKLATHKLGLALSFNFKENWVFLVKASYAKNGLTYFKITDPKDSRIFYGCTEQLYLDVIINWFESALCLVDRLVKIRTELKSVLSKFRFLSYDNKLNQVYFEGVITGRPTKYTCALTVSSPYVLVLNKPANYAYEFSSIYFKEAGVSLNTRALDTYIQGGEYGSLFDQTLTAHQTFTRLTSLKKVMKELETRIEQFQGKVDVKFK